MGWKVTGVILRMFDNVIVYSNRYAYILSLT